MEKNYVNSTEIPMGLGMALAKDINAMNYFATLDRNAQQSIIEQTHSIRSKEEMQSFVSNLGKRDSYS